MRKRCHNLFFCLLFWVCIFFVINSVFFIRLVIQCKWVWAVLFLLFTFMKNWCMLFAWVHSTLFVLCALSTKKAIYKKLVTKNSNFVFTPCIPPQVSVCIPVLRLSRYRKKVLFYCHFPDQLLTQRKSALKKLYRAPIDLLEECTTGMADMVCKLWGCRLDNTCCYVLITEQDCHLACFISFIMGKKTNFYTKVVKNSLHLIKKHISSMPNIY